MRLLAFFFMLLTLAFAGIKSASAQEVPNLPVSDPVVSYHFGEYINFQVRLTLPSPASEAYILFRADGESATRLFPITVGTDGSTTFRYEINQGPVRPFASVHIFYRVKLQDGQELTSDELLFHYDDDRFPWQKNSGEGLIVHWYAGDTAFGQAAMDVARRGIQRSSELLTVNPSQPIDVYIYASTTDLQKALEIGGVSQNQIGGHASPDLHVALVAISPGPDQGLEMDRKIPHELAHILTYDLTQSRYQQLPTWLREGIATQAELAANPDYPLALSQASEKQTLIPLGELCNAFPVDGGSAFLAYAESQSFTHYLIDKYGQSGLLAILQAYGDGLDCEQGAQRALGRPLSQLESDWRSATLGENASVTAIGNLFPYLAILAVLLSVSLVYSLTFRKPQNDG